MSLYLFRLAQAATALICVAASPVGEPAKAAADAIARPAGERPLARAAGSAAPFKVAVVNDDAGCDPPADKRTSDLCAQWKAADAAERSALWATIGTIVAIVGSGGVFWQLRLTRKTLDAQMAVGRPVVICSKVTIKSAAINSTTGAREVRLDWTLKNHGATLGFVEEVNVTLTAGRNLSNKMPTSATIPTRAPIAPQGSISSVDLEKIYVFSPEDQQKVSDERRQISVLGFSRYHDVTGARFETMFALILKVDDDWNQVSCSPREGIVGSIDKRLKPLS